MSETNNSGPAIPVDRAREIGQRYDKRLVLIIATDAQDGSVHVVTWGRESDDKEQAAQLSPALAAVLGATEPRASFEDFRTTPAAEQAKRVDQVIRERDQARFNASTYAANLLREALKNDELIDDACRVMVVGKELGRDGGREIVRRGLAYVIATVLDPEGLAAASEERQRRET